MTNAVAGTKQTAAKLKECKVEVILVAVILIFAFGVLGAGKPATTAQTRRTDRNVGRPFGTAAELSGAERQFDVHKLRARYRSSGQ